jgi:predicted dehydrogenase
MRVALIGYGLAGRVFHAPLITATDGLELAAIVTADEGRAAQAREAYPGAEIVARADDLWDGGYDAVVVGTPNRSHVPLALAAIEAGTPVVVDKPLASTAADGQRVLDAARDAGVLFTVFQNRRWDSDFLTARALLEQGALGDAVRFESRYERPPWGRVRAARGWRELGDPAEGGGLLLDLGSHLVDQALALLGTPIAVYAELDRRAPGAAVDDDDFVALEFPAGVRAHLTMSKAAPAPAPRLRLTGTRGTYLHPALDPQEAALVAGGRPGDAGWGMAPEGEWGQLTTEEGSRTVEPVAGAYERFYAGLRDAVSGNAPPPVDPAGSVLALRVLDAARRAAAERTVVAFGG